jgi:type VI secretion system protein VasD
MFQSLRWPEFDRAFAGCLAGCLATVLLGCGSNPPEPELPATLAVTLSAAADINPDLNDRPSPVAVAVYQLKSVENFNKADYFSLYDPARAAPAGDLLGREQLTVQPGQTQTLTVPLAVGARFLGVTAAYRDLEQAAWRTFVELPSGLDAASRQQGQVAEIRIEGRSVIISLRDQ